MKLLTKELLSIMPSIKEIDAEWDAAEDFDPIVRVKYFTPWSNWTWYGISYDQETGIMFGLVDGFEIEMGDFSIAELEEHKGKFGMRIERDLLFDPLPLSELRKELRK